MSLAPSRLSDVENSAYFKELCQDNFEVLAEEIAKRVATYQNGSPTTVIGPPTSGTRVLDEFWRDALGGGFRCTAPATSRCRTISAFRQAGPRPGLCLLWRRG